MSKRYFLVFLGVSMFVTWAQASDISASSEEGIEESIEGPIYSPRGAPVLLNDRENNFYKMHEEKMSVSYTNVVYEEADGTESLGFLAAFRDAELFEMHQKSKLKRESPLKKSFSCKGLSLEQGERSHTKNKWNFLSFLKRKLQKKKVRLFVELEEVSGLDDFPDGTDLLSLTDKKMHWKELL